MNSTFVVGIDGSAASLAALRWAIDRARSSANSRIVIVHAALTLFPADHTGRTFYREDEAERYWDDVRARVEHGYAGCVCEAGVPVVPRTVEGAPADVINAVAAQEDADVIVLGNARHSAVEELCLGSVA
ncbi:MAG: universal stress protein, partial [Candidatus Dormibacteraeota bacterium]|nr:universal stress protein [Candidatus Dormibacteraeota bacterium]